MKGSCGAGEERDMIKKDNVERRRRPLGLETREDRSEPDWRWLPCAYWPGLPPRHTEEDATR